MALWPVRNLRLKLVSVCIAGLLWMIVAGDRVVERVLRVPVELQGMPADLELVGPAPDTVDVRVRGSSNALTRLGPGDIAAVIDLKSAREGRRVFTLGPGQVLVPAGLETVQVSPSTLSMEFEATVTRRVPVEARTDGDPEKGFRVVRVATVPEPNNRPGRGQACGSRCWRLSSRCRRASRPQSRRVYSPIEAPSGRIDFGKGWCSQ